MTGSQTDARAHQRTSAFRPSRFGPIENWPVPEICAFLITVTVMFLYRKLTQPEGGDSAIWDYVGQCILRGQIPYRDVVEIKSPLSAYLSAAAMFAGKWIGIRDVIAVRLFNVLMAASLSTVTYIVGLRYLRSRIAAAIAFVIPLTPPHFTEWVLGGTEPKLPMILFGMLSVLFVAKKKPFWAGFFSMLSCLSWQPGLMFTGVAFFVFSRYLTSWRDRAALKVIAGSIVPLAIVILYYFWTGALSDLWSWTVAFNFKVYAPETARSVSETAAVFWKVLIRVFRFDLVFVALGIGGLITFSIDRFKAMFKPETLPNDSILGRDAILMAPVIYFGFCLINFQSGPDLIPLFPFIGLFAGYLIVKLFELRSERTFARLVPQLALIALLGLVLLRSAIHRTDVTENLRHQDEQVAEIANLLQSDDRVYVHGSVELLVLLNRPNMNPFVFLDRGKDSWIAKRRGIEFRDILTEMEAQAPKIIAVSRLGKVAHRREIEQWIAEHYNRLDVPNRGDIYIRKPE